MLYASGLSMSVGDIVVADGMEGIVVCDFDRRRFAVGYEDWEPPSDECLDDNTPSTGVMIRTAEAGLIHYTSADADIEFVGAATA